jgi:hypothetical protein
MRLAVCPDLRGTDLHRELRDDYRCRGSYRVFQRQLRVLRSAVVAAGPVFPRSSIRDATNVPPIRVIHRPGFSTAQFTGSG